MERDAELSKSSAGDIGRGVYDTDRAIGGGVDLGRRRNDEASLGTAGWSAYRDGHHAV